MPDRERGREMPTLYIGYDLPKIQKIALRLQALAAVSGVMTYVPTADTRLEPRIDDETSGRIWKADAVIIFISTQKNPLNPRAVDQEIEYARQAGTVLTIISVTKPERRTPAGFDAAIFALVQIGLGLASI